MVRNSRVRVCLRCERSSNAIKCCFEIRKFQNRVDHCGGPFNGLYRRYSRSELVERPKRSHQLDIRCRRLPRQWLSRVQPTEVCRNVDRCVSVTMQDDSTIDVLATAKPSDLVTALVRVTFCVGCAAAPDRFLLPFQLQFFASLLFQFRKRTTLAMTNRARL